ncbi:MAG TPA: universal stress protein [Gallionellaceae bacterium]|nr:universal stress protein [Gallionellaceae bacterium]
MKILIPVAGTESANRAVEYVIASQGWLKESPQVLLLNVQWKIASGNVKLFINQQTIDDHYREQGLTALAKAREKLDAAGMAYSYHISVGMPAKAIVRYAAEQGVDQVVLGAGEQRTLSSLLLGSVVDKVLHLAAAPVLLIK